jgi:hypothetical protein
VEVSDGEKTVSQSLDITVTPASNDAPQITALTATPDSILETETSQLLVSAIDPDSFPGALTVTWTLPPGGGSLNDYGAANPIYTPPNVDNNPQVFTLNVEVSDGEKTVSQSLDITVTPVPGVTLPVDVIVDDQDANTSSTGDWTISSGINPWEGNSIYSNSAGTFQWWPDLPEAGSFEVHAWWTYHKRRSTNVPYRIAHSGDLTTEYVNQNDPALGGQWVLLGIFNFTADGTEYVEVSSENGQASADAIRFVKQ